MAKQIPIVFDEIRTRARVQAPEIALNAYEEDIEKETKKYGKEGLVQVLRDMIIIREFETVLDSVKKFGEYQGKSYTHLGPAHLSIGQESASVGQCLSLEREDFIFGSHRSHGEILAKSMSCIHALDDGTLLEIMEQYNEGEILKLVESHYDSNSVKDLATQFILYGLMAEIFARSKGINRGLGGSMHAFFVPFGSMPNNAIVGASADIALGSALYKKINDKKGIVIANIGDAAMGCGPVWEALVFSSMDQYKTLWGDKSGAPPYMLNIFNNFYGMGGQTLGETMGMKYVAKLSLGLNEEGMHSERVDGFNPLAVADAVERKKKILLEGRGPVFMDTITYRVSGHSPSDASSYRTKEEIDEFVSHDPILAYRDKLVAHKIISEDNYLQMKDEILGLLSRAFDLSTNTEYSPYVPESSIEPLMFSRASINTEKSNTPDTLIPYEENPRIQQLQSKSRYGYDKNGKLLPAIKLYAMRDAIFEAVLQNAYKNPSLVIYGEENRDWGGAFACYRGLTESLPYHRLFNSPISEGAIVGTAVGYALSGGSALVELMYCDFLGRAGDEVFNQMPKWQAMSGGILKMPMVLRLSVGDKYGAQHSQDWSALLAHIPGLIVMFPSTPYDAKGMLHYALTHTDPVVFLESQKLYGVGELFHKEGVPDKEYTIELGEPIIRRKGNDLTIISIGSSVYHCLHAADTLQEQYNVSVELIDLRFINPLNYELILESVKKTGKLLLVSSASERASYMHTVASHISASAFHYLDRAPIVLGSKNWIIPPAELEDAFFPNPSSILDVIDQNIIPLNSYVSKSNQSRQEYMRRHKKGV